MATAKKKPVKKPAKKVKKQANQPLLIEGQFKGFTMSDIIRETAEREVREVRYRDWETDRKSTRLNSSHSAKSRMPSSA